MCPWPCEEVNQLKGPARPPSHPRQCSEMQQQMASKRAHVIQKASFSGPVFFSFPALCACVGLAGSLLLCKTPLLATASIPLPRLLGEFANIRASAQEAARAPTSAHWAVWKTTGGGESTFGQQVLSLAFSGVRFKTAFLFSSFLCHLPHPFFFGKVLGCKVGRSSVGEWGEKTLLINFESCLWPFMGCIS